MNGGVPRGICAVLFSIRLFGAPDDPAAAKEHADQAASYIQSGDLPRAETELQAAVRFAPTDSSYLTSLGGVLGMQGKLREANTYFERAVKANPADTTARRNLAANEWRLGELKPAQANLERLLRAQPEDHASVLLLGMVSENLHDYTRAAKLLGSISDLVAERPETVAALASAWYHTDQREKAHRLLEGLLTRAAEPQGVFLAAGVAAQAADYGIAETLLESIRASYPDEAKIAYNVALFQFQSGRVVESQRALLGLIRAGHVAGEVYDLLGRCYERQGNTTEAIHILKTSIHEYPSRESSYANLATVLIEANRLPDALKTATRMTNTFPKSALAFLTEAGVELKMSQYTDAVHSYHHAIELAPSSLDARSGLASAQWGAGMRTEAQSGFEALIKEHPRNASLCETYASLLLDSSPDDAAEAHAAALLKTAVDLDPNRAEAHYRLGNLALKSGSSDDALQHLETAARLSPDESRIQFALARLYRRLNRAQDATNAMDRYERLKAAGK